MGGLVSRLRQSNDSDYEKILSDLDSNIRKAELRLSAINVRERRLLSLWLIYSVMAWIVYVAVFALYLHQQYYDEVQTWAVVFTPVALGIPLIYLGRSLITVWYKRAKTNEESQLNLLRADQRLKVEELKKKTAYYSTKTLLERYDPSSQQQRSNGPRLTGPDSRSVPSSPNGQPRHQQPNMMDPGLRQRQGLGVTNAEGIPIGQGQGRPTGVSSGIQHQHQHQSPIGHGPQGVRGSQGPYPPSPGHPHLNNAISPQQGSPNYEKHWYDRIVDVIVGDEGPETKYALVCGQCFAHNGLALPQEIEDIQYICPKCNFFNPSRRKTRMATAGLSPMTSPELTLLQAQSKPLPASRDPSPAPSRDRSPLADHHRPEHNDGRDGRVAPGPVGLGSGNSPSPVMNLPSISVDGQPQLSDPEDMEFVNNWNDSDADGVNHDEGEDENNSDNTEGYNVESVPSRKQSSSSKSKKMASVKTTSRKTKRT
ncbi:hypothetical protein BGX28_004017 [Mortierella sp. GBA30]|nr:hypothetical protein BGX28_004017 [Mortierella sp. GBA30]